jgi:hypothetical protein
MKSHANIYKKKTKVCTFFWIGDDGTYVKDRKLLESLYVSDQEQGGVLSENNS